MYRSSLTVAIASALLAVSTLLFAQSKEPPPGVRQILPRGGIPAIFDPVMVPAAAAEIADDAWVLGVVVDGQAHAYSLNLLNHHEIVNDRVGDTPIAAVW